MYSYHVLYLFHILVFHSVIFCKWRKTNIGTKTNEKTEQIFISIRGFSLLLPRNSDNYSAVHALMI